jgi:hypothetical protein
MTAPQSNRRMSDDDIALERYRYLLRTAPPEEIERAHAEAFAALTADQRRRLLDGLAQAAPESEVRAAGDDPDRLARLATRTELRDPGTMERVFGTMPARGGILGGMGFGGSFMSMLAGAFIGTAIANTLFNDYGYPPGDPDAPDTGTADADTGDGQTAGGDWGDSGNAGDQGGMVDGGGDVGDAGGDFGGDFGGFDV